MLAYAPGLGGAIRRDQAGRAGPGRRAFGGGVAVGAGREGGRSRRPGSPPWRRRGGRPSDDGAFGGGRRGARARASRTPASSSRAGARRRAWRWGRRWPSRPAGASGWSTPSRSARRWSRRSVSRSTWGSARCRSPASASPGRRSATATSPPRRSRVALPFGLARLPPAGARPGGRRREAPSRRVRDPGAGVLAAARTRGAWIGGAAGVAAFLAVRRPRVSRRAVVAGGAVAVAAIAVAAALPARWTRRRRARRQAVRARGRRACAKGSRRARLWRARASGCGGAPGRCTGTRPCSASGPGTSRCCSRATPSRAPPKTASCLPPGAPRRVHDDLLERLTETGPLGLLALLALYAAAAVAAHRARAAAAADSDDLGFAAACAGSLAAVAGCGLDRVSAGDAGHRAPFRRGAGRARARGRRRARPRVARPTAARRCGRRWAAALIAGGGRLARAPAGGLAVPGTRPAGAAPATAPEDAVRALADLARAARADARRLRRRAAHRLRRVTRGPARPTPSRAAAARAGRRARLAQRLGGPGPGPAGSGRSSAGARRGCEPRAGAAARLPGRALHACAASRALGDEGAAARARAALAALARERIRRRAGFWTGWTGGNLRPCARASRSSTTGPCRCVAPSGCWNRSAGSTRARRSSR